MFYIYKTKALLKVKKNQSLPNKSTYLILEKPTIDINNHNEFKLARKMFKN